eukprot:COSAG06_NODE_49677_length_323_cov_2.053571_1_plen_52_part_10
MSMPAPATVIAAAAAHLLAVGVRAPREHRGEPAAWLASQRGERRGIFRVAHV